MQVAQGRWWVSVIVLAVLWSGWQVAAQAQTGTVPLALKGYDPVAYFSEGKPVKGVPGISHEFDDARYLFSNTRNKAAFVADPGKYAPQFAGLCSGGMVKGMKVESNPELWAIVDGKLYLFSSLKARDSVQGDRERVAQAHTQWTKTAK